MVGILIQSDSSLSLRQARFSAGSVTVVSTHPSGRDADLEACRRTEGRDYGRWADSAATTRGFRIRSPKSVRAWARVWASGCSSAYQASR